MEQHEWGYAEENGPSAWHKEFPIAVKGKRQSPINITIVSDRYINGPSCCHGLIHDGRDNDKSAKCISYECLRQRMTQNLSLHEHNQNYSGQTVHKRSAHNRHHHNHHHDNNGSQHHHRQSNNQVHHLRHHTRNENEDFLDSTGNSPAGGSSVSSSSITSSSTSTPSSSSPSSNISPPSYMEGIVDDHDGRVRQCPKSHLYYSPSASPINYYQSQKKIFLGYPRSLNNLQVVNTGHGWQVNIPTEIGQHTLLSGPPLGNRDYRLAQFHCHWGEDCSHGSEHLINGKSFAAELHFVHWNNTDFNSIEEAAKHKHGLAVLGVLVQALEGEQNRNKYLDKIIQGIECICDAGSSSPIKDHFDIKRLFPVNRWTYASYEGSLTTPPLSEVVDWIVFFNPIQCSTTQEAEMWRQQETELKQQLSPSSTRQ